MRSAFFPHPSSQAEQQGAQEGADAAQAPPGKPLSDGSSRGSPWRHGGAPSSGGGGAWGVGRGVRFPSSRRYLWDRTPAGPQVLYGLEVRGPAAASVVGHLPAPHAAP